MIAELSNRIVDRLVTRGNIPCEEKEIYQYGAELLLSDFVNFSLILLLGAAFGRIGTSILFLISFVPIRRFTGGYHASSHLRCRTAMIATFLLLLLTSYLFPVDKPIQVFLINAASVLVIARFAPIENPNKPLSDESIRINRQRAIQSSLLVGIVSLTMYALHYAAGIVLSLTLSIIALLMIIEVQKRERR